VGGCAYYSFSRTSQKVKKKWIEEVEVKIEPHHRHSISVLLENLPPDWFFHYFPNVLPF